jgi:Fe-S-cluster containining protein
MTLRVRVASSVSGAACKEGCGLCCDAIALAQSPREIAVLAEQVAAFDAYWHAIGAERDAGGLFTHDETVRLAQAPPAQGQSAVSRDPTETVRRQRARRDVAFIAAHWHALDREEALRRNPPLARLGDRWYYECDAYDPATRRCTAHAERPPVCRDFPWYGRAPSAGALRSWPGCSYWADVPGGEPPAAATA